MLSIIMPFCNENPMVRFTIQSLVNELQGFCDFEIIAINNLVEDPAVGQCLKDDGGYSALMSLAHDGRAPYLKVIDYNEKLSHWNAKNAGLEVATGDMIFFCDAHVMLSPGSLRNMLQAAATLGDQLNGSLHLPISYLNDKPGNELIYLCVHNTDIGLFHYRFTSYRNVPNWFLNNNRPYAVPCMSTCGMLIPRRIIIDQLEGWPSMFGIYGGGENYINYVQAVLGYQPHIMPGQPLYHYAAPRGYRWDHYDWMRNRFLAVYLSGGPMVLTDCVEGAIARKDIGSPRQLYLLAEQILTSKENQQRRDKIKAKQVYTLDEWVTMRQTDTPQLMLRAEGWK